MPSVAFDFYSQILEHTVVVLSTQKKKNPGCTQQIQRRTVIPRSQNISRYTQQILEQTIVPSTKYIPRYTQQIQEHTVVPSI